MHSALSLIHISKEFRQGLSTFFAIKDVNISIAHGEIVALMGQSGSGKTTLLQIAGLLDRPTSGIVTIGSKNCSELDEKSLSIMRRQYLGFIFQFHHLLPEFDACCNVAMPLLIAGANKYESIKKAKAVLKELGLFDKVHSMPYQLSGGEQQRVAIARALVHNPSIILADEPTGSLDQDNSSKVFDSLYKMAKDHNTACLFATHNQELAKKADRIIVIENKVILSNKHS